MYPEPQTHPVPAQLLRRFADQHVGLEAGTVERATIVEWARLGWVSRVWTGREEWRVTPEGRELLRRSA